MKRTSFMTRITSMLLAIMMLASVVMPNFAYADNEIAVGTFTEPGDDSSNKWCTWVNVNVKEKGKNGAERPAVGAIVEIRLHDTFNTHSEQTYQCITDTDGNAKFNVLARWNKVKYCKVNYKGKNVNEPDRKSIRPGTGVLADYPRVDVPYNFSINTGYKEVTLTHRLNYHNETKVIDTVTVDKENNNQNYLGKYALDREDGHYGANVVTDTNSNQPVIDYWAKKVDVEYVDTNNQVLDTETHIIPWFALNRFENIEADDFSAYFKKLTDGKLVKDEITYVKSSATKELDADSNSPSDVEGVNTQTHATITVVMDEVINKVNVNHRLYFDDKNEKEIFAEDKNINEINRSSDLTAYVKSEYELHEQLEPEKNGDTIDVYYWAKNVIVNYVDENGKVLRTTSVLIPWKVEDDNEFDEMKVDDFSTYVTELTDGKLTEDGVNYKEKENDSRVLTLARPATDKKGNPLNTQAIITVKMEEIPNQVIVNHYLYYADNFGGDVLIKDKSGSRNEIKESTNLTDYALDEYTLHEQTGDKKARRDGNTISIYYWAKRVAVNYVLKDAEGNEVKLTARDNTNEIINYKGITFDENVSTYSDYINLATIEQDGKNYVYDKEGVVELPITEKGEEGEFNGANITLTFKEFVEPKDLKVTHRLKYYTEYKHIKDTDEYLVNINEVENDDDKLDPEETKEMYSKIALKNYILDSLHSSENMKVKEVADGMDTLNLYYWAKKITVNYVINGETVKSTADLYNYVGMPTFDKEVATYAGYYETEVTGNDGKSYGNGKATKVELQNECTTDPNSLGGKREFTWATITVEVERTYDHTHEYEYENFGLDGHRKYCTEDDCDYEVNEQHTFNDGECVCGEIELVPVFLGRYQYSSYNLDTFIARAITEFEEYLEENELDDFISYINEWELVSTEGSVYTLKATAYADQKYEATIEFTVRRSSSKKRKQQQEVIDDEQVALGFTELDRTEDFITRAEFTEVISKLFTPEDKGKGKNFKDINGNTYKEVIDVMTKFGVTRGYSEEEFGPDDLITNEQIMNMLVRGLINSNKSIALTEEEVLAELTKATDGKDVSFWAKEFVAVTMRLGLLEVDAEGNINPLSNRTRGDVNVIFKKYLAILNAPDEDEDKE